MYEVGAKRTIAATPERVWEILSSADRLVALSAGITRLDGQIGPDGRLALVSDVAPKRVFRLKVAVFEPNVRMAWHGGMPFGLFSGKRQFLLSANGDLTDLEIREEFTGLMAGMIWRSMPDLQPSFDRLIDAIKLAAEEATHE